MSRTPPVRAEVFSFDEMTQCQAVDRPQPSLPLKPGRAGTMTHDYKRNGTVDLFAAMNLATGQVLTDFRKTHKGGDVLRFFKQIDAAAPRGLSVHVVLDNLSAHSAPEVTKWLAHRHRRRWHLHFTPTSSSWLNLVERWFKELTDKRLRRGRFTSVADLTDAITVWAGHWNADPKPFVWKATAQEIITKVQRGRATLHQIKTQTDHSATRTTECATPLMSGANDSETIVTRMATPCGARRCGRPHRPDALAKNALYLVPVAGPDDAHRPREGGPRRLVRRARVSPLGDQVGQQQPPDVRLGRRLTRLPPGEVDVRRVVLAVEVAGLAEERFRAAGEPDQRVARRGVRRVGQRAAPVLEADAVRLDRVVDPLGGDRERPEGERAGGERVERVDVVQRSLVRAAVRRDQPVAHAGRPVHRKARVRPVRRGPAHHHVGTGVLHVNAVQLPEPDRVHPAQVGLAPQGPQRTRPEIQHQTEALGLDEVRRAGGVHGRKAARAAQHGKPHLATWERTPAEAAASGPRNRYASRANTAGSPVARNRCSGAGASSGRKSSRSLSTR